MVHRFEWACSIGTTSLYHKFVLEGVAAVQPYSRPPGRQKLAVRRGWASASALALSAFQWKERAQRRPGAVKEERDDQARDVCELEFEESRRVRRTWSVLMQYGVHDTVVVKNAPADGAPRHWQVQEPDSGAGMNPSTRAFYPLRTANNAQIVQSLPGV